MPVYSKSHIDGKSQGRGDMEGRFDVGTFGDVMYESGESQFATEFVSVDTTGEVDLTTAEPFASLGYVDGHSKFVDKDGNVLAMQAGTGHEDNWLVASEGASVTRTDKGFTFTAGSGAAAAQFVGAYDSERDLAGQDLGEVELVMKDYHFNPRPISLGVTWTQLAELTLDTSFGVSAEEMLMDSAAQEIKKTLDFQAVKYASAVQKTNGYQTVEFDASAGEGTKDSYWHTAQLVGQAIDEVQDTIYNKIMRGGVSAIVGGAAAVRYLKLNQAWKDTGRMPAIGVYKVGEFDGKQGDAVVKVA